jgi:hypothetical protein
MIKAPESTNSRPPKSSAEGGITAQAAEAAPTSDATLVETHPRRALIGFLPTAQALPLLMGRGATAGEDLTQYEQRVRHMAESMARRPAHQSESPELDLPLPLRDRIMSSELVAAHLANLNWRPGAVDLRKVGAFQSSINLHGLDERVEGLSDDLECLLDFAIPTQRQPQQIPVAGEQDGKSYTLSSANPNLRVIGSTVGQADVTVVDGIPPIKVLAIQYFIAINPSFMQVVHFNDHWFLRDGYHRAAALLRAGITTCPCLIVNASDLSQLGIPDNPVPFDVLFGSRPPMLTDFWDDEVSAETTQPVARKVIRTRADEFAITG